MTQALDTTGVVVHSDTTPDAPPADVFYACTCGAVYPQYAPKCTHCDKWQTISRRSGPVPTTPFIEPQLEPEDDDEGDGEEGGSGPSSNRAERICDIEPDEIERYRTGIADFDRVLGGGYVPGGVYLLSGPPGCGKSSITLQIVQRVAAEGRTALYATAEERKEAIRSRSDRFVDENNLDDAGQTYVMASTRVDEICAEIARVEPDVLILDSVQTIVDDETGGAAGGVSQVRACAARLVHEAKSRALTIFIVCQINKDSDLAGPKTLEHIVDAVLLFEVERSQMRTVRASKNRFGSTLESAVFQMTGGGLRAVEDPSRFFLAQRRTSTSGSTIAAMRSGSRAVLVEIQSLTTKWFEKKRQITTTGVDSSRAMMLIAVLERHSGYEITIGDVYLNVVGGISMDDPGADLAICMALMSSRLATPVPSDVMLLGEVGLGGEVRETQGSDLAIVEAARNGFKRIFVSPSLAETEIDGVELVAVDTIGEALLELFDEGILEDNQRDPEEDFPEESAEGRRARRRLRGLGLTVTTKKEPEAAG